MYFGENSPRETATLQKIKIYKIDPSGESPIRRAEIPTGGLQVYSAHLLVVSLWRHRLMLWSVDTSRRGTTRSGGWKWVRLFRNGRGMAEAYPVTTHPGSSL